MLMHDQTEALELFFDRGGEITCLSFERYAQEVDPRLVSAYSGLSGFE